MKLIMQRIDLLKKMYQYILDMGDETILEKWYLSGGPVEEEDFEWYAEDDDDWKYICGLFGRLIKLGIKRVYSSSYKCR